MVGKILGQFAVGLLVLALYLGLGLIALLSFASLGLLDPTLIVFLLVFFLLAYLSVGAFMAAIGSAVNELREAQGLMTPGHDGHHDPVVPLDADQPRPELRARRRVDRSCRRISNFVIMLRLASSTPPPLWQTLLSIVAGAAGVVRVAMVRGEGVPDRAADVRQAAQPRHASLRWARHRLRSAA